MKPNRAQVSKIAIQRLYISMRHLFFRGHYKPLGVSGEAMKSALLDLKPEIYGSIAEDKKLEISGLLYVFQRLPQGIEECRFIKLISREGFESSSFSPIIPAKRRRSCYRVDDEQMVIEMTRGRSDIYDVMTHLTFLYIEAEKIRLNALDSKNRERREWLMLKEIVRKVESDKEYNAEIGFSYLSTLIGRTYEETAEAYKSFADADKVNNLFSIIYHLGQKSIEEHIDKTDREISFSATLREEVGHHIFGEQWAHQIKSFLFEKDWLQKRVHIISSNLHSVMNAIYAKKALSRLSKNKTIEEVAELISADDSGKMSNKVRNFALANGMYEIHDWAGTNITVQIFDLCKVDTSWLPERISNGRKEICEDILIVMDYAFGEQAFECMDELLKPLELEDRKIPVNYESISIMGKAGILEGGKGDIMIPNAFVFEGSTDNYVFKNELDTSFYEGSGLGVYLGPMITVLGTSLQNKDILRYFKKSSWKAVGLEMEGAHYQKAIQSASKIRNSVKKSIKLRYGYYASDNPLHTGSTLASGGLGVDGVKPTYLTTLSFLHSIFKK